MYHFIIERCTIQCNEEYGIGIVGDRQIMSAVQLILDQKKYTDGNQVKDTANARTLQGTDEGYHMFHWPQSNQGSKQALIHFYFFLFLFISSSLLSFPISLLIPWMNFCYPTIISNRKWNELIWKRLYCSSEGNMWCVQLLYKNGGNPFNPVLLPIYST